MRDHLLIIACVLLGLPVTVEAQRVDQLGDPLPEGAIARMGTARLRETDTVAALAFSANGKTLASVAVNSARVHLWDVSTGKEPRRLPVDFATALAFAPDGKTLAIGDGLGRIHVHDLAGKAATRQFQLPARPGKGPAGKRGLEGWKEEERAGVVRFVGFSADGKQLLAGSDLNAVGGWKLATGKEVRRGAGWQEGVEAVAFSADGKQGAFRNQAEQISVGTAGEKGPLRPLPGKQSPYTPAAFSPDGKTVAAEVEENVISLSNSATRE